MEENDAKKKLDIESYSIGMKLAIGYIERGAESFYDVATKFLEELGKESRPYIKSYYNGAREILNVLDPRLASKMTPYEEVRDIDVDSIGSVDEPKEDEGHSRWCDIMDFACDVIVRTPAFRDFAIAIMDYMGEPSDKLIRLYEALSQMKWPYEVKFDEDFRETDIDTLRDWYNAFLEQEEIKTYKEEEKAKEDIDELIKRVQIYRNSKKYFEMMTYVARMPYLAPYNAMLVYLQKPGTNIALSIKNWRKYGRRPKENANPLIALIPFGPVQTFYDFESTEMMEGYRGPHLNKAELIEVWCKPFTGVEGKIEEEKLENLIDNLPVHGISIDDQFDSAASYAGYICQYPEKSTRKAPTSVLVKKGKGRKNNHFITSRAPFFLSVNKEQNNEEKFVTICHELGHFFCYHVCYGKGRSLSHKEKEFEAETVAWLVCRRHGIDNPSERYLASFVKDGKVPRCSLYHIMNAVKEIETMMNGIMVAKDGLWYKHDKDFKNVVDKELAELKDRKEQLKQQFLKL